MASVENKTYGTSLRKFNTNLLKDEEYVRKINQKSREWIEESRKIQNPRVPWDFLKYKIRYEHGQLFTSQKQAMITWSER